jgi:hypothetical protein
MGWWESFVVTVTLLTVFARLRSKRSAPDAPSSPRYSRSSRRTEARPTLLEPDQTDTYRVFHVSYCPHCSARDAIRLSETALERRPWRVTWRCVTCNNLAEAKVPAQLLRDLRRFDRVNGMRISLREYWSFVAALDDLEEAFEDELL